MNPSEILNKAVVDADSLDSISKEVGETVANWYRDEEPSPTTLLYVVAALVQSIVNDRVVG